MQGKLRAGGPSGLRMGDAQERFGRAQEEGFKLPPARVKNGNCPGAERRAIVGRASGAFLLRT